MRLADTNVLIYAVSNRDADALKRVRAAATLKEPELALSVQVLQGVRNVAKRTQLFGAATITVQDKTMSSVWKRESGINPDSGPIPASPCDAVPTSPTGRKPPPPDS